MSNLWSYLDEIDKIGKNGSKTNKIYLKESNSNPYDKMGLNQFIWDEWINVGQHMSNG